MTGDTRDEDRAGADKAALRARIRAARQAFVAALDPAGRALALRVPPSPLQPQLARASVVAGYLAIGSEASPAGLLDWAATQGARIALPFVSRPAVPMRFLAWQAGESLHPGPLGLMQPDPATAEELAPDLILAPLIAFDRGLRRLGQGAGFYDRAFARYPDARRIGVAWSVQEVALVPDDPWDVPLHAVVTEKEWIA